jgi:uncharacterized protein with HEPN domain
MHPDVAKFLLDIDQACALLEDFTRGKSFSDYQADVMLRSAVERQFIIVGEALMQASKLEPMLGQSIPALRQIVGFRNVLVHGYAVVQHLTVWGVIQNEVTPLRHQVRFLLPPGGPP